MMTFETEVKRNLAEESTKQLLKTIEDEEDMNASLVHRIEVLSIVSTQLSQQLEIMQKAIESSSLERNEMLNDIMAKISSFVDESEKSGKAQQQKR